MFPSPYGVSFILMFNQCRDEILSIHNEFPSPYGVSFILIDKAMEVFKSLPTEFPSPYGVSFILIIVYYIKNKK